MVISDGVSENGLDISLSYISFIIISFDISFRFSSEQFFRNKVSYLNDEDRDLVLGGDLLELLPRRSISN